MKSNAGGGADGVGCEIGADGTVGADGTIDVHGAVGSIGTFIGKVLADGGYGNGVGLGIGWPEITVFGKVGFKLSWIGIVPMVIGRSSGVTLLQQLSTVPSIYF